MANNELRGIFTKIKAAIGPAAVKANLNAMAAHAVGLVTKRTRLGYGVKSEGGERFKLSDIAWSPRYAKLRKVQKARLDETTRPTKSNLTFSGQMLRSVKVIRQSGDTITVGPSGSRDDGQTNAEVARANAKRGRVFMKLSGNEHAQLVRIARRQFSDLLKRLAKVR